LTNPLDPNRRMIAFIWRNRNVTEFPLKGWTISSCSGLQQKMPFK